jgi:hypothetical protein
MLRTGLGANSPVLVPSTMYYIDRISSASPQLGPAKRGQGAGTTPGRSAPAQPRLPPGPTGLPEGAKREQANGTPGTEPGDREAIYKSLCLLTEQDSALCNLATHEETALALKLL